MKNKPTKAELKKYKEWINGGFGEYLLAQGGKMGILFVGIIFLMDYVGFLGNETQSAGMYIFLGIFFGFFVGLWGWHNINKLVKESGKKK